MLLPFLRAHLRMGAPLGVNSAMGVVYRGRVFCCLHPGRDAVMVAGGRACARTPGMGWILNFAPRMVVRGLGARWISRALPWRVAFFVGMRPGVRGVPRPPATFRASFQDAEILVHHFADAPPFLANKG